jgi:hypothetical protein
MIGLDMKRAGTRSARRRQRIGWLVVLALLAGLVLAGIIEPCDGHGCPNSAGSSQTFARP